MRSKLLLILAGVVLTAAMAMQTVAQRGPARQITQISGDLYRASSGAWHGIFLVTPDGIILADPLNTAFATWLKEQLAERFKVPVRYVI